MTMVCCIVFTLTIVSKLFAKEPEKYGNDTVCVNELDSLVITATRHPTDVFNLARSITVADKKNLAGKNRFSVLDALDDEIGVWIEKRTTTSSDPIIRGLSGANILALIDGNSLTTFWGEGGFGGDDMYGKVDGESIDHIEVVRGPSSVMYGSNALGGVINFITKKPPLSFQDDGFVAGGRIKGGSGSASDYLMGRGETWGATSAFRYFLGATTHRSGDMKTGSGGGYIIPSGGRDWSIDFNSELKCNENNFVAFGGQYMKRPETYRSYRPSQLNSNERWGLSLEYRSIAPFVISDVLKTKIYYQYKYDSRQWFTDSSRQDLTAEGFAWWRTIGAEIQSNKQLFTGNMLIAGINYQIDIAESPDDEQFTMKTSSGNQKATPDTKWHNGGAFIQDEWNIGSVLTLTGSFRCDYFRLNAKDNIFYSIPGEPDTLVNIPMTNEGVYVNNALTGGASAVFHFGENINCATSWMRGFRMVPPSFGFRQTGQGVLIPNGFLDPMTADQFEISPRLKTDIVNTFLTGYYTVFHNFQQPIHGEYNGSTSIDFNKNGTFEPDERVYVNASNGDAFVTGVEFEFDFNIGFIINKLDGLRLVGGCMYDYGRMQFPGQEEMPLRHTHPFRGIIKLRYNEPSPKNRWWWEAVLDAVDRYDKIASDVLHSDVGYLKNPRDPSSGLIAEYGLPSYYVVDVRAGFRFYEKVTLTIGVDNLFDRKYRTAHSRMDAMGRNVIVGLEVEVPTIRK